MFEKLRDSIGTEIRGALGECKQHSLTVALLTILSLVLFARDIVANSNGALRIDGYVLLVTIGLTFLAFASRYAFLIVGLLLVMNKLVYSHLNHHWGHLQINSRIEAAFESPVGETLEYLQTHIDYTDYAKILISLLFVCLLVLAAMRPRKRLKHLGRLATAALVAWLPVFVGYHLAGAPHVAQFELVPNMLKARLRYEQLKGRSIYLTQHPIGPRECQSKYEKVVIVLGESAVSDHMGVFGYPKDTTPFASQSKPFTFDALAPSNQTRHSIAMLLTSATPGHFDVFYTEHSLVGQLRACGFHTLWISNQGRVGPDDSFTTSLALEADEQVFLNDWSYWEAQYDEQIVKALESRHEATQRRQATFVHLIGSHTRYKQRFPESAAFLDGSDTVSDYDNSIRYTDSVLSDLYRMFGDESLLFIYLSDHGSVVSNEKFGAGFFPGYKEEFRVPLLIWTSDSPAIEQIRSAVGKSKINTESLDDIVRFLIGMSPLPNVSTSRAVSVLTPEYVQQYDNLESFVAE